METREEKRLGSVKDAAMELGCTESYVRMLCREGALAGVLKVGLRDWIIPLPVERLPHGPLRAPKRGGGTTKEGGG